MDYRSRFVHYRRLTGLGVATALLVSAFAPAMAASQAPPADSPLFSKRSIAKVVSAKTPESPRLNRAETNPATAPKQATKSGAFFKTRTGMLVIAVMAVGTGYAIYSAKEDRIRGSVR